MTIAPLILALLAAPAADRADAPVILDFTAPWCGPCQQMKPAVAQLAKAGYPVKPVDYDTSPLVKRYKVAAIPTFVVVDPDGRELGRVSGYRPARDIADLYNEAQDRRDPEADREPQAESPGQGDEIPPPKNPEPWKTVVRIKIENTLSRPNTIEFGSGTIISSTPDEAIILTCAHIFKIGEGQKQYPPRRFPLKIEVHLSDGNLRQISPRDRRGGVQAQVHMVERFEGEAIDYDFGGDVGLIRIRPGRRLPATPVVPTDWAPKPGMDMTTVGCSEGNDATAWSTKITKTLVTGVDRYPNYEAIECVYAPKRGRSGGGLYTIDGRLAGVCDFAEPVGGHGLYATPRTIHKFLARNDLQECYAPDADRSRAKAGMMVAGNRPAARPKRSNVADTLRAQGPDEPAPKRLTIPPPEDLKVPAIASEDGLDLESPRSSNNRRKPAFPGGGAEAVADNSGDDAGARVRVASGSDAWGRKAVESNELRPTPADMSMDSSVDPDPFEGMSAPKPPADPKKVQPQTPKSNSGKIWKPAKPASAGM